MGTFHQDRGELHGITVAVETSGGDLWVGRCDRVTDEGVVLLDADVHREGEGASREEYLQRAASVGVWARVRHVVVPNADVTSLRRLAELERR